MFTPFFQFLISLCEMFLDFTLHFYVNGLMLNSVILGGEVWLNLYIFRFK